MALICLNKVLFGQVVCIKMSTETFSCWSSLWILAGYSFCSGAPCIGAFAFKFFLAILSFLHFFPKVPVSIYCSVLVVWAISVSLWNLRYVVSPFIARHKLLVPSACGPRRVIGLQALARGAWLRCFLTETAKASFDGPFQSCFSPAVQLSASLLALASIPHWTYLRSFPDEGREFVGKDVLALLHQGDLVSVKLFSFRKDVLWLWKPKSSCQNWPCCQVVICWIHHEWQGAGEAKSCRCQSPMLWVSLCSIICAHRREKWRAVI